MSADKPDRDWEKSADADSGFLARWSRLKQDDDRARSAGRPMAGSTPGRATTKPDAEAPPVDLAKLPKIDDLTSESDIAAFLQKGVPDDLRRQALRKAWTLDPKIRDFVEMAENQYDWNKPDGVPGFGPLAPDVDIKALLAQAIGEWPGPAAKADAEATEVADTGGPKSIATGADASKASATPAATIDPENEGRARLTLAAPTDADDAATERKAAPSQRRRHGGALPRPTET